MHKSRKCIIRSALCAYVLLTNSAATFADDHVTPPTNTDDLFEWLSGGQYKDWPAESVAHKSAGPHPVSVIAYLNPMLNDSLSAKAVSHPKGSAAVKELLDASGKLNGWAVSLKTDGDG